MGTVLALIAFIVYKALQLRKGYRERAAAGMDLCDGLRESACSVVGTVAGAVSLRGCRRSFRGCVGRVAASPETGLDWPVRFPPIDRSKEIA